jgi:hypothetical protein
MHHSVSANTQLIFPAADRMFTFGPANRDRPDYGGIILPESTHDISIRQSVDDISRGHGQIQGDNYQSGRGVTLRIWMPYTDPIRRTNHLDEFLGATHSSLTEWGIMRWQEADEAPGSDVWRQLYFRLANYPAPQHEDGPYKRQTIQLTAAYPYIVSSETKQIDDMAPGLFSFVTEGNVDAPPTVRVQGPCEYFGVLCTSTGMSMQWTAPTVDEVLTADDWITVDCLQVSAKRNGVDLADGGLDWNHRDFLRAPAGMSSWEFSVGGTGSDAARLRMDVRSHWW